MADSKKKNGGVLVIPNEANYPASVTFRSPTTTRTVRSKNGETRERAVVYTFKRGEPRRVERAEDYAWLKSQVSYQAGRGVFPLFREVQPAKKLSGDEAARKILDVVQKGLAAEGISLNDLVESAESVAVEAGESPVVEPESEDE